MATINDVDIRLVLGRLRPLSEYRWIGTKGDKGYASLAECIAEWRDDKTAMPNETALMAEWAIYQAEETTRQQQENEIQATIEAAKTNARNIPNWATWDEAQVLVWMDANLSDAAVDALTIPAGAKTIIKTQNTMLRALARMVVALRDDTWPDLNR